MKKALVLVAITIALVAPAFLSMSTRQATDPELAPGRISSSLPSNATSPIVIASNADFTAYSASGDGTAGDPWVLEDYLIACGGSGTGITIAGTTDYYIVRDSFINESGPNPMTEFGILLNGAPNGRIENVTIEDSGASAIAVLSNNIVIADCTISDTPAQQAIFFGGGAINLNVSGCTFNTYDLAICSHAALGMAGTLAVEDCTFNGAATSTSIKITDMYHVSVSGCTFTGDEYAIDWQRVYLATIADCTFLETNYNDIKLTDTLDMHVNDNTFDNSTIVNNGHVAGDNNTRLHVVQNQFLDNNTAVQAGVPTGAWIVGNTILSVETVNLHGFFITSTGNVTIANNTFDAPFHENGYPLEIARVSGDCDIVIDGNIFNNTGASMSPSTGMIGIEYSTDSRVRNNHFINVTRPLLVSHALASNISFTNNTFVNIQAGVLNPGPLYGVPPSNVTFHGNYYRNYFDTFPESITLNSSTDVLEFEWELDCEYAANGTVAYTINDTAPLYLARWFPRGEQVFFRFFSNVDYQGVPFEQVQLYIDGTRVTTSSPVIGYVLFDVLVYDYSGRLLHDQTYNLNASGIYINIGLDITVAVHFRFYSTLDYFGLDFELVKLYVNGTRITTPSPTMRPAIINVVVRDYADIVIYNATVDLATTGIYLDIGLALAPITVVNDYNRTVVFTLIRGTATTRLAMASGMQLDLRLALGDYSYIVSETNGTVLATNDVTFSSASPAGFVISFGWTELTPGTITVYQAQLLDYVFMIALFGLITGAVVFVAFRVQHATPARGARAIPSKPSVSFPTIKLHNPFSKKEHAGRRGSSAFVRIFHDRW